MEKFSCRFQLYDSVIVLILQQFVDLFKASYCLFVEKV
jgi:hypothetical protein